MNVFSPASFGSLSLRNRLVMAPLTRTRAGDDGTPGELLAEYYGQRASLGMIITEGTWPVQEGRSWIGQPGIETAEHVEGWRAVADAVHARGGTIVMQVMHGGRISHPSISGTGRVVGPSALAAPGTIRTPDGKADLPVAHALSAEEIHEAVQGFANAARNAIRAGLDGVEVHGANGYLIHQFLAPSSNERTDEYGGTPEKRARFAIEVVRAVAEAIDADRVGIRLSPDHGIQGVLETDPAETAATYEALGRGIAPLGIAFVDVLHADPAGELVQGIGRAAGAPLIVNSGFSTQTDRHEALTLITDGVADAVAVGRAAIANPDLAERWEAGADENAPDATTFYTGGARGYTDYPRLAHQTQQQDEEEEQEQPA